MTVDSNNMVLSQTATFVKKNGDNRTMNFVKLNELPQNFLNTQLKGTGQTRTLAEGMELVWDLDAEAFRVFNWNTIVGDVTTNEINFNNSLNNNTTPVV